MIYVKSSIKILDGPEGEEEFIISSDYSDSDKVDIQIGGFRYSVLALDLIAAIENAINTANF